MKKFLVIFLLFFLFPSFAHPEIYKKIENELKNENYEEAISLCKELIKSRKKDTHLLLLKAKAEWNAGLIGDCIETLKEVLKLDSKNQEAIYFLCKCYIGLGDLKEAHRLTRYIKKGSRKNLILGILFYEEGKYDIAKEFFEKIKDKTYQKEANIYLAEIAIIYNERPKAINILKKIKEESPYYARANYLRSFLQENRLKFKISLGEAIRYKCNSSS